MTARRFLTQLVGLTVLVGAVALLWHMPAASTKAAPAVRPAAELTLGAGEMAVSSVNVNYFWDVNLRALRAVCQIEVRDGTGAQVQNANVTMTLTDDWSQTLTTPTSQYYPNDWFARATKNMPKKARCWQGGYDYVTCTVNNVTHPNFTYVPSQNTMNTDTESCD